MPTFTEETVSGKKYYKYENQFYSKYSIKDGDTLSEICLAYGYSDYMTIYNDPANKDFKEKYPKPDEIDHVDSKPFYIPAQSVVRRKLNMYEIKSQIIKVSLVYLPETGETLAFDEVQYKELLENHDDWEKKIIPLQEAKTKEELKKTKTDVADALKDTVHINKHGSNRANGAWNLSDGFVEGYSLAGKKWVYVVSDKMKNHRRSYKDDKRLTDLYDKKGQLSPKKIKDQFAKIETKIKTGGSWGKGYQIPEGTDFGDFVKNINDSLQYSLDQGRDPDTVNFDFSAGAQLLRYYQGASLNFGYDPSKGKIGIEAAASAKASLAEGILKSSAYWPNKSGHELIFNVNNKEVNLGTVRASLNFMATGFVGASAAGSLAVKIETEKADVKNKSKSLAGLKFTGADLEDQHADAPFTASGQLFAGVEAGGEMDGTTEWKNPENDQWKVFLKIGYGVTASAGIGLTGEFKLGFKNGHFLFRAKVGAVVGLGGSGAMIGQVDAGSIYEFIQFVYHKLKDSDFSYQHFIEDTAFKELTKYLVTIIEFGEDVKNFVGSSYIAVDSWWDERNERKDRIEKLARSINEKPELLKFTTPEAKGAMIYTLTETFFDSFEEEQEDAVINILRRVQTLRDFHKVLEHITKDGSVKCTRFEGRMRLYNLIDGFDGLRFEKLRFNWLRKELWTDNNTFKSNIYQTQVAINTPVIINRIA